NQCINQKTYHKSANLAETGAADGCNLHDSSLFITQQTINNLTWSIQEIHDTTEISVRYVVHDRRKVFHCYSIDDGFNTEFQGKGFYEPPFVFQDRGSKIPFVRKFNIPSQFHSKIDAGVMMFEYIMENPFNANSSFFPDAASWLQGGTGNDTVGDNGEQPFQYAIFTFYDSANASLPSNTAVPLGATNSSEVNPFLGLEWWDFVPPKTRYMEVGIVTNFDAFSAGQITMHLIQLEVEYYNIAQRILNICVIIAGCMAVIVPVALMVEDMIKKRRLTLKMIDVVHKQGSRFIRAAMFTLMLAFLNVIFSWLRSKTAILPFFDGIKSAVFTSSTTLRTVKSLVFIGFFLLIGASFWPVFLCYAHTNDGSRMAAIMGLLVSVNMAVLRVAYEYINADPNRGFARVVAFDLPEIIGYATVLGYFLVSVVAPSYIENQFGRKTYFKDVIYVRTLLKTIDTPIGEEEPYRGCLPAFLRKKDTRPVWQRGVKPLGFMDRQKLFFSSLRIPTRMVVTIGMIIVFSWIALISVVVQIIDTNPNISCLLGIVGDTAVQYLETVSQFIGTLTASGSASFGTGLSDTLEDLNDQIQDQTKGGDFVTTFYELVFGSIVSGCVLTSLLLVYNIIDMLTVYNDDIKRLRVGDYGRMDVKEINSAASSKAIQFMGIQIGYVFIGAYWTLIVMNLICLIAGLFFTYPFMRVLVWRFIFQNGLFFISLAVSLLLSYAQQYIVELIFIAKVPIDAAKDRANELKLESEGAGQPKEKTVQVSTRFWISKPIGYNHVDYLFLFPNLISGLVSFLSQVIKMFLGSAMFAYRLDKKTQFNLPFLGGRTINYFSWLIQEHHHSNPVVLV
ncbi:hypothetical protein HK101_005075, partial [Irineochytrium annulatum]